MSNKKIKGHCVNSDDFFVLCGMNPPLIYVDSEFLKKQKLVRQGLCFTGPIEKRAAKMRELANFLNAIADAHDQLEKDGKLE